MTPQEFISGELRQFAKEFIQHRTADIIKKDLRNTDALLKSLYAKVQADPERGINFMTVFFMNYGRYQDMRRRYTKVGGADMVQDMEAWIEKEGISKFVKGRYTGVYKGMTTEAIVNKIAWGIINKYKKKGSAPKRGWWNKGKERDISIFYDHLLRGYAEAILAETKQKIETA